VNEFVRNWIQFNKIVAPPPPTPVEEPVVDVVEAIEQAIIAEEIAEAKQEIIAVQVAVAQEIRAEKVEETKKETRAEETKQEVIAEKVVAIEQVALTEKVCLCEMWLFFPISL
jgi:hypothetical protein